MSRALELAHALGGKRNNSSGGWLVHCPAHDDANPSLSVSERDGRLLVRCHAGCSQEAVIAALRERGLWPAASSNGERRIAQQRRYPIVDAGGLVVAVHERTDYADGSKTFTWRRNGTPGLDGLKTADLPLYRLPGLLAAPEGATVIVTEGEKAADALVDQGFLAVGTVTGASSTPSEASLKPLAGHDVVLWPDADAPGRAHMDRLAQRLAAMGTVARVLEWPDAPPGGDAADFFEAGGTAEALRELLTAARPWTPAAHAGERLQIVRLSTVTPEAVAWLWDRRIPLGKLTVIAGDAGVGKSTLLLAIAARVTRGGRLPYSERVPSGDVILLTAEDGIADTVWPRFDREGGDASRVHVVKAVLQGEQERWIDMREHLPLIEDAIWEHDAKLVIIDPILAYTGRADSYKDAEVRGLLAPLASLAERTGAAIIAVMHLNKRGSESNPRYRITAATAWVAAARVVLLVAEDADNPRQRYLASVKNNLSLPADTLAFHFADDGGLVWDGTTDKSASMLLAAQATSGQEANERKAAEDFLKTLLADGPVASKEVRHYAEEVGLSWATVRRAQMALGIKPERMGGLGKDGYWAWILPAAKMLTTPSVSEGEHLNESEHLSSAVNSDRAENSSSGAAKMLTTRVSEGEHLSTSGNLSGELNSDLNLGGALDPAKMLKSPKMLTSIHTEDEHLSSDAEEGEHGADGKHTVQDNQPPPRKPCTGVCGICARDGWEEL